MLDFHLCRGRQRRLLDVMNGVGLEAAFIGDPQHVYYFTGFLPFWQHHAGLVLMADGESMLIRDRRATAQAEADGIIPFDADWLCTNRQEQPMLVASQAAGILQRHRARQVGVDASSATSQLGLMLDERMMPLDPDLQRLRRVKDADELVLMRRAIGCAKEMYDVARRIIEPGIPELTVYAQLHAAAVQSAGEPMSARLGNDYACGAIGGPPRNDRVAQPGEIYLLDLGPAVGGYFADACRAFCVDRSPTDAQQQAWRLAAEALDRVVSLARPGARCRDIFGAVNELYQQKVGIDFPHHLGHGVGLQPHEFPHLNPKWDDTLMEGEVFACEPGVYAPDLRAGVRLENMYRVTKTGVENLTPFLLEMS